MRADSTVFIVDDDEAMRNALHFLGEVIGLKMETYASGQAFLDSYTADRPGCLVLDLRMPGMSGLELQAQLILSRIHLPIIVITGHGNAPEAQRALEAGAVDVIEKPFKPQVLIDRICNALQQYG